MSHPIEGLIYFRRFFKVSAQIVVALGGHFATLGQDLDFYEGKKIIIIFQKEKTNTLVKVKSLQIEVHSKNLLL